MRLFPFALLLALASPASADVITLKDGRVLEGEVLKEDDKTIKLKMAKGAITINRADIASHDRKLTPAQEYVERVKKLDPKDAKGRLELAGWAAGKEMEGEAIEQYLAAWGLDTTLEVAKAELEKRDYHLEDGRWRSPDEYWPSRGHKKLDGKWYSPREYDWRVANKEFERKQGLRKAAEEAVKLAETNIGTADGRARTEVQKLEGMKVELDSAKASVGEQKAELDRANEELRSARSSADLGSASKKERMEAETRVARAKTALTSAERDLKSAERKLDDVKQGIADGDARVEQIRVDREEALAKIGELRAALVAATEESESAKIEAEEAKRHWESSK